MRIYTGVGSRETPGAILDVMQAAAYKLAAGGWTLRSGAAEGADQAFEAGCDRANGKKEIFIAWDGFCGRRQGHNGVVRLRECDEVGAYALAAQVHPAWDKLKRGGQGLHARNCYQVLGANLSAPSKFLMAYATLDKHGEPKGGTRTAIKLAEKWGVQVINLYIEEDLQRVEEWIS